MGTSRHHKTLVSLAEILLNYKNLCQNFKIIGLHICSKIKHISKLYSNIHPTRCNVTQFIFSGNCSTCFGWYHHALSGAQTTISTASGICHTVIAIAADSNNGVTNTRCCRYSCLRS